MEDKKFDRVLNKKDVFALAFGAMIGWGWVVLAGDWIQRAGALGAMIAFLLGGILVVFVGLTYAELTAAMPECGGEHVFSHRALGKNASFVCTWAIILGYVGVVAFEACAFPNVIEYIAPNFLQGHLYTVAGFDVYATWVAVGVISSIIITAVNYFGVKPAAFLQGVLTLGIALTGILLMCGSVVSGDIANATPLFKDGISGILSVAIATPFMFVGFDVIPQAAEEINLPFKKIGKILLLSIFMAVVWYMLIILAVSLTMTDAQIQTSTLVTADAMKNAFFGSSIAAKLLIVAGMAGIVSSWNAFFVGGSRAIYALAESKMLPTFLTKLHPKYKTPTNAVLLIGIFSCIAPFFGKKMMTWLVDAGSFSVVLAYLLVCISFIVLRKKEPDMPRPYKVKNYKLVGYLAIALCGAMLLLYMPGMPSGLIAAEWGIVAVWTILGAVFYFAAKAKYVDFGSHTIRTLEDLTEKNKALEY